VNERNEETGAESVGMGADKSEESIGSVDILAGLERVEEEEEADGKLSRLD
jgi:hypothetical protein